MMAYKVGRSKTREIFINNHQGVHDTDDMPIGGSHDKDKMW